MLHNHFGVAPLASASQQPIAAAVSLPSLLPVAPSQAVGDVPRMRISLSDLSSIGRSDLTRAAWPVILIQQQQARPAAVAFREEDRRRWRVTDKK